MYKVKTTNKVLEEAIILLLKQETQVWNTETENKGYTIRQNIG